MVLTVYLPMCWTRAGLKKDLVSAVQLSYIFLHIRNGCNNFATIRQSVCLAPFVHLTASFHFITIYQNIVHVVSIYLDFGWFPTVDGSFVPQEPMFLLQSGAMNPVNDVMIGVNKNEGSVFGMQLAQMLGLGPGM